MLNKIKLKGFTIVELMIVLLILGILAAILIPKMTENSDSAKISGVGHTLRKSMPESIAALRAKGMSCSSITAARMQSDSGLDANNPWGTAWSISAAASAITLTYPMTGAGNATNAAADLASSLTGVSPISSATASSGTLTVVYDCP